MLVNEYQSMCIYSNTACRRIRRFTCVELLQPSEPRNSFYIRMSTLSNAQNDFSFLEQSIDWNGAGCKTANSRLGCAFCTTMSKLDVIHKPGSG